MRYEYHCSLMPGFRKIKLHIMCEETLFITPVKNKSPGFQVYIRLGPMYSDYISPKSIPTSISKINLSFFTGFPLIILPVFLQTSNMQARIVALSLANIHFHCQNHV